MRRKRGRRIRSSPSPTNPPNQPPIRAMPSHFPRVRELLIDRRIASDGDAAAWRNEVDAGGVPIVPGGGQREDGTGRLMLPHG